MADKAQVTLNQIQLSAVGVVAWRFQTGTQPYTAIFTVHTDVWKQKLFPLIGKPVVLEVIDSRGAKAVIRDLYIVHETPSGKPSVTSFAVADRRYWWTRKLIVRDYNVPKKTGDRTALNPDLRAELRVTIDQYQYRPYSLDERGTKKWTPKSAVLDVLKMLEGSADPGPGLGIPTPGYVIESFPIEVSGSEGEYSLQNIMLRDQGDVALARLLSYIPGAEVYVDADGMVRVFDGTDLKAAAAYFKSLPPNTWDGEKAEEIHREEVRPREVIVHYQRELECVFDYSDDYSGNTQSSLGRDAPFIENVIPTVDPVTTILDMYDPEIGEAVKTVNVPPGTWVQVDIWLLAMDKIKPDHSFAWTFQTVQMHWLKGDLDGALGGRGKDLDPTGNVSLRIAALKQHFRQTFRINRRYMERLRDIQAIRVALLDPVTGARGPAAVWGQACIVPTTKGQRMSSRKNPEDAKAFRNVDYLAPSTAVGTRLIETAPGPTRVELLDRDLGIFRLNWMADPYATVASWIPCNLIQEGVPGIPAVITRNLADQDTKPMGAGMKVESGTNGIFLSNTLDYRVMVTIVPAAPNNKRQFHRVTVRGDEISSLFRTEFGVGAGKGPPLEVFIAPSEATARFGWDVDADATTTIGRLLGLDEDDPNTAGMDETELPGFVSTNKEDELESHARAVAAEMLAPYVDSLQGTVSTVLPKNGKLTLKGNMAGVTLMVGQSAKVSVAHEFPGQQKPISRLALMPETTRHIILGIVPFGKGDK